MEARSLHEASEPTGNRLLDALPGSVRMRLLAGSREVSLRSREVLREPGRKLRFVYFPLDCVISLVVRMGDGGGVEAATVGREGVVGVSVFLGAEDLTRTQVVCQVPTSMARASCSFVFGFGAWVGVFGSPWAGRNVAATIAARQRVVVVFMV